METARWDALMPVISSGFFATRNLGFVIVNVNINYRAASFINDTLVIKTALKSMGGKSIIVYQQIYDKSKEHAVCDADVTFVLMDLKTRKAVPLTDELKSVFDNM
jgi:thioesterase-3